MQSYRCIAIWLLFVSVHAHLAALDFVLEDKLAGASTRKLSRNALKEAIGDEIKTVFNRSIDLLSHVGSIQSHCARSTNNAENVQAFGQTVSAVAGVQRRL